MNNDIRIGIVDDNFSGSLPEVKLKQFSWDNNHIDKEVVVFTDFNILKNADKHPARIKIAWLVEPPYTTYKIYGTSFYDYIKIHYKKFDLIFTYDISLLSIDNRFRYVPFGTTWIWPEHRRIYEKSDNISIIASNKRVTPGHILRHDVINAYRSRLNGIYGRGYFPIDKKLDGLKQFRYSIVIENENTAGFFTEKIMDCFMTGTIPIYHGCTNIDEYFNATGILKFNTLSDMDGILNMISPDHYNSLYNTVIENFNISNSYIRPEVFMWKNGLKELFY